VVARLLIVKPRVVTEILDNKRPGIVMSREFASLLQRESQLNEVQALSAQIQRVALQAAGCRLLGYSGVQIAGLDDPQTAEAVVDRIATAIDEYTDYTTWLTAWKEFHSRVEMAPYPHRYYMGQATRPGAA
jgi:hypothetical protein